MLERSRVSKVTQYVTPLLITALALACGREPGARDAAGSPDAPAAAEREDMRGRTGPVLPGIDVLATGDRSALAGRRVGLITNHTGLSADGTSTIDVLYEMPDVQLVALFAPEHGIRGTAEAGERVESGRDARTGLPIHSLYGDTRKPTPEMLHGIDALVFDIQDIGTRYYTYVWTMTLAMQAAAEQGLRFVVLDRPNPIGGTRVQGNVLDPSLASFVGLYPVPMRHGMTAGELARLVNAEHGIGAELVVVPVRGWTRAAWYDETGLDWVTPSPNMPSLESAAHYPGTCLFEGTNVSVGRGTPEAFRQIGAPWLNHGALARALEGHDLAGVRIDTVTFTPRAPGDGKYGGEAVRGIRFTVTDRDLYDPTLTAVAALVEIQRLHGDRLTWRESHFDRLAGTRALRTQILAGASADEIFGSWAAQIENFERTRARYLLYQ